VFVVFSILFSSSWLLCRNGAPNQEIEKYIEKINVFEDKYELYMELKNYPRSMEMAAKLKDPYRLQEVSFKE
jgi:predicted secreted protein